MTTILIKKKDTPGAPAPGDLTNAAGGTEIAVNTSTKRIYTKDSSGTVVELGTNSSSSTIDALTVVTSATLSYGTATQVQFLNGSKILTGSSSLTWDGTTLTSTGFAGPINGTVGATTANTGAFTTLTTSSTVTHNGGTASQVQYLNGSKVLSGSSNMTFDGSLLTVANLTDSSLTSGRVTFAGTGGNLTDSANLTWNGTSLAITGALTATTDSTFSSTGALTISKGTTAERPTAVSGMLRFNTTTTEFEGYNGTTWASVGGAALSNDTSTSSNLYPLFAAATSGTASTLYTGNAKLLYKPSTGEFQSSELVAGNGLFVNSATVSADYTIPAGSNAMSAGPVTVNSGITVTVSSGSVWTVV
jgi:hypothetical protein